MYPDRVIVLMYIHSYSLSTIPDDPNTLTLQFSVTNNTPRDRLHSPVTISTLGPTRGKTSCVSYVPPFLLFDFYSYLLVHKEVLEHFHNRYMEFPRANDKKKSIQSKKKCLSHRL